MNPKTKAFIEKTRKEFNLFFGFSIDKINVTLLNTRKEINKKLKRKTEGWEVGWVNNRNIVFILSEEKFEKESTHKKEDFWKVLKHEIAHVYLKKIMKNCAPEWLCEGIPLFLAKQTKKHVSLKESVNAIDYFCKFDKNIYKHSGNLVYSLYKKFGKKKLLELASSIKRDVTKKSFSKSFKEIYGFNLNKKELVKNLR